MSHDRLEAVFRVANESERESLLLLNKKMKGADIDRKLTPEARVRLETLDGHNPGDYPIPENVRKEFERFGMKTPDASESLTIKKGD